ncbi:MAG TPA: hydantoinase B/oxoprolinase family protein [Solirubrobacterales bacterium]|jgi:N-methylhydantoinase B
MSIDPITAQVINGRLSGISLEMARKLVRSSFSILFKESEDIGCALIAADGWQLSEADTTPLQMGPFPFAVQGLWETLEERGESVADIREGDIFIHNDPYLGASHAPDIEIILPIFHQGQLIAYSCTTGHHLDIGGAKPGTSVIDAVDDWACGLRLRGLRLREAGLDNRQLWQMIEDNVRIPELTIGDLQAQIAAAEIGAQRLLDLVSEMGVEQIMEAKAWAEAYSERMLRAEIAKLPDGEYRAEGISDGFPEIDDPAYRNLPMVCTLRVRGEELEVDLTGTAQQIQDMAINMPFRGTVTVVILTVVRSVLLDTDSHVDVPQNQGMMRPLQITAPSGSMANPTFPVPTLCRSMPACVLADVILKAFAEIVPERCCAGISVLGAYSYTGIDNGRYWGHWDIYEGSYGARWTKDGMDAMDTLFTNTRCAPIEEIETEYPLRCMGWQLNDNPIGHGRFRGGVGGRRDFMFLVDGFIASESDTHTYSPWGLAGGLHGSPGSMSRFDHEGAEPVTVPPKMPPKPARAGQIYRAVSGNGGGSGPPVERDPALVERDFRDDLITLEEASEVYGVAIDPKTRTVRAEETAALREQMAAQ